MQKEPKSVSIDIGGVSFSHPIGLGAGLNRDCENLNRSYNRDLSFIITGPVTPVPQSTEKQKRGFFKKFFSRKTRSLTESKGIKYSIVKIQETHCKSRIISILSFLDSSIYDDLVAKDLSTSFSLMYDFPDMFAVDITQPRGDGTTPLMDAYFLEGILDELIQTRLCYDNYKPILVKIGKNCLESQLNQILDYSMYSGIDGIILDCSNGDFTRLEQVMEFSKGRFPVIADGIANEYEAKLALKKGATLISIASSSLKDSQKIIKSILLK